LDKQIYTYSKRFCYRQILLKNKIYLFYKLQFCQFKLRLSFHLFILNVLKWNVVYIFATYFKAARLQIHANCHEIFENVFECMILWNNQKEAIYTLSMVLTT
jgi:hypothetical protein